MQANTINLAAMLYAPPTLDVLADAYQEATTHTQKIDILEVVEARLKVIAQEIDDLPNKPTASNS